MTRIALAVDPNVDETRRMTVDEFLVGSEHRPDGAYHELVHGRPVEMQAERNRHALVKARVLRLLEDAVLATDLPCVAFPDGVTVVKEDFRARRPDVVLRREGEVDLDGVTCDRPLLIVEVASPSTARGDTTSKLGEYMSLESVRHYVIIDPEARFAYHHARASAHGDILTRIVNDGTLVFEPPGVSIDLADCFTTLDRIERSS